MQKRLWRVLSGLLGVLRVFSANNREAAVITEVFFFVAEGDQLLPFISVFFFPSDVLRGETASGFEGRI